ncbi:FG-GAP repeat domain-containing protein [Polyangium jinanense]|uniref:VCBS repeat-containing protein n=1 Tax=Polyangium jinanense TaxID=2829994 RepID=A0A9X3X373_9BACT|nr:VCBS repeat-containing protein [Polyangium jinanense]MDC3954781.1 VCBS repeat-containing protein [Polyangium jinanense]MDC3981448.1 VCBS repeat-containing protein [Polyangium jinanense]
MRRAGARSPARVFAALVLALAAPACAPLPTLSEGVCGNFVVEAGEDCDGHAPAPGSCAPMGATNECRFVCDPTLPEPGCPAGFGCGSNRVCRRASGTIEPTGERVGYTWPTSLRVGDFNLDGAPDLLLLGAPDAAGLRPARALSSHGFSLSETLTELPFEIAAPTVGAGTGEAYRDIAFADREGVAILRGYSEDAARFAMVPSIILSQGTSARLLFVDVLPDAPGDEIVALTDSVENGALLTGIAADGTPPAGLSPMPGGEAEVIGAVPMLAAALDEAVPCKQILVAYRGATTVPVFTPCRLGDFGVEWNTGGAPLDVKLAPEAPIDRGVFVADVDVDGHLDLVVGAGGQTYVALGLGDGTFVSKKNGGMPNEAAPYMLPEAAGDATFPLAMADLNTDGHVDFIVPRGIVISRPAGYELAYGNLGAAWSEAVIGHFNGNDALDVVASTAGVVDLDFLNNAGDGVFSPAVISTHGSARLLTVGDVDGDLLDDIVFSEQNGENGELVDQIALSFGVPFGVPTSAVAAVEAGSVEQITAGHYVGQTGMNAMAEVAVVFEAEAHNSDALAVLQGRTSRNIYPALPLRGEGSSFLPIALTFGNFGDETADIAALGVNPATRDLRLFRVEAFEDGPPGLPAASEALDSWFSPVEGTDAILFRHGALVAAADLNDDGLDEVVLVGAHGEQKQAAVMVADYDEASATFQPRAAQPFAATLSIDADLLVADVDGDGHEDALVRTGSPDTPSSLVILWGNETGDLGKDAQVSAPLDPDGSGVRALTCVKSPRGKGFDVLVASDQAIYRYELDAGRDATAAPVQVLPLMHVRALAAADFDHDGVDDIAVQTEDGFELYRSIPELQ